MKTAMIIAAGFLLGALGFTLTIFMILLLWNTVIAPLAAIPLITGKQAAVVALCLCFITAFLKR